LHYQTDLALPQTDRFAIIDDDDTLTKLDKRLQAVANRIRASTHADVGSDHGYLLRWLLSRRQIRRGIAIENKQQPFQHSQSVLAGYDVDVRLADGLHGLFDGEADSLSICGMGGRSIVRILSDLPDRVPQALVLQPNRDVDLVRSWGLRSGYHLIDECIADQNWSHQILQFRRATSTTDPAYKGLDQEAALIFGPLLLKRFEPTLALRLQDERAYLNQFDKLGPKSSKRLAAINRIL
tara:strand:- start:557411 stop:558124 length:714 start_codon:yes stop_codon:yes gene_type:complete